MEIELIVKNNNQLSDNSPMGNGEIVGEFLQVDDISTGDEFESIYEFLNYYFYGK
jgi:hypothetical protein